jgi:hypothetical protein
VTSSVVVGVRPGGDVVGLIGRLGGAVRGSRAVDGLAAVAVDVPAAVRDVALGELRRDRDVRYAEPDGVAQAMGVVEPDDPYRDWDQEGLGYNRIPPAWAWTTGSAGTVVAVLDTGVTPNSDLDDGRVLPGHDFVDGDDDASDDQGHGTLVAGVIAGEAGNGVGVTGVCWQCRILPVRVLKRSASGGITGSYADIAAGIVWAADHGANVINLSLGGPADSQLLRDAVAKATAAGVLVVAAAGDKQSTAPFYPAAIEPVVAVGGTDNAHVPLSGANTNPPDAPWIDMAALGTRFGLNHRGDRVNLVGSSAAAPLVSGTAALARALRPDISAAELRATLLSESRAGSKYWGGGVRELDAGAVAKALGPADTEAPVVEDTGLPAAGTVLCNCSYGVRPVVRENRDIVRTEILVNGAVVASSAKWTAEVYWAPTGLTGPAVVTVRARDSSGNVGSASTTLDFDTSLSAAFVTPQEYAVVDGTVPVTVTGDADIARIRIEGQTIDATAGSGPWTTTVDFSKYADGKQVLLGAYVDDRAGNQVFLGRWVSVDHDAPVVVLDDAQFPKVMRGHLMFSPHVVDHGSLVQLTLLADGKVVATSDWHTMSLDWPDSGQLNGTHVLTFQAVDEAGHRSEVSRTVVLDNAGPTYTDTAPAGDALVRGRFVATVSGVKDPSGIAKAELYFDGKLVGTDRSAPFSLPVDTGRRNGRVSLSWAVYDTLGNGIGIRDTVTVDNTPPKLAITAPRNGAKVKGTVKISVTATDAYGVGRVELLVDGRVVATDSSGPYLLKLDTAKQKKTMRIQVRAYDRAGNTVSTPARVWHR